MVSKRPGSPQSVIILATIKNVQTRRQHVRVRSVSSLCPHRSFSGSRVRGVLRVLADTRIIILFHGILPDDTVLRGM